MRKPAFLIAATVACFALEADAQQKTGSGAQPTFRANVTLVTLDVSALDSEWRPIVGLGPNDFEVELGGQRRPVRAVDFESHGMSGAPRTTSANPQTGLRPPVPAGSQPRTFVMLVDDLSYGPGQGRALFAAAGRFVASLPAIDRVALITFSGRRAAGPTSDRAPIEAALRGIIGVYEPPQETVPGLLVLLDDFRTVFVDPGEIALAEAVAIDRGDDRLAESVALRVWPKPVGVVTDAVRRIASDVVASAGAAAERQARAWLRVLNVLQGFKEERPVLIVLSRGFATDTHPTVLSGFERARRGSLRLHMLSEDDAVLQGFNRFDAAIWRDDDSMFKRGLEEAAGRLNGTFQRIIGTADRHFGRILTASDGVYRLGVEIPPDAPSDRSLSVKVRVGRRGAIVHVAREVFPPGPPVVLSAEQQIQAALGQGRLFYGLPFAVAASVRRDPSATHLQLHLYANAPPSVEGPLSVAFALISSTGQVVRSGTAQVDPPAPGRRHELAVAVPVPPGHYRLRVAAADRHGSVSSVDYPLTARLARLGPYLSSDIFATWADESGRTGPWSGDEIPDGATTVELFMELYQNQPTPKPPSGGVRVQLVRDDGEILLTGDHVLEAREGAWVAGLRLPIQQLEPGAYTVTITVVESGASVGTRTIVLRKTTPATPALPSADNVLVILRETARRQQAFHLEPLLRRAVVDRYLRLVADRSDSLSSLPVTLAEEDYWRILQQAAEASGAAPFIKGLVALRRGDSAGARAGLETALERQPTSAAVMLYLGAMHALAGRDKDAVGAWQVAIADPSVTVEWYEAQARGLARLGELREASELLTEASDRWPGTAGIDARLGELLIGLGEFDSGRRALERSLELNPTDPHALFLLTGLAFAKVLSSDRTALGVETFATLADRYLQTAGPMADVVSGWRQLARRIK